MVEYVQKVGYSTRKVIETLLDSIERMPDADRLAARCLESIEAGALVSVDTLELLYTMDELEYKGQSPTEALREARRIHGVR